MRRTDYMYSGYIAGYVDQMQHKVAIRRSVIIVTPWKYSVAQRKTSNN